MCVCVCLADAAMLFYRVCLNVFWIALSNASKSHIEVFDCYSANFRCIFPSYFNHIGLFSTCKNLLFFLTTYLLLFRADHQAAQLRRIFKVEIWSFFMVVTCVFFPQMLSSALLMLLVLHFKSGQSTHQHQDEDHYIGQQHNPEHDMNVLLGDEVCKLHTPTQFPPFTITFISTLHGFYPLAGCWRAKEPQSSRTKSKNIGNYKENWHKYWQAAKCRCSSITLFTWRKLTCK